MGSRLDWAHWAAKTRRRQRRVIASVLAATTPAELTPGPRREAWGAGRFRGVYATPDGRFQAKIRVAKRLHCCGTFDDEEDAARAVDRKARELLGDKARLNFPEEG